MVRHYYCEWGRGRERTERAAKELGPMLGLGEGLHKQLGSFFPVRPGLAGPAIDAGPPQ